MGLYVAQSGGAVLVDSAPHTCSGLTEAHATAAVVILHAAHADVGGGVAYTRRAILSRHAGDTESGLGIAYTDGTILVPFTCDSARGEAGSVHTGKGSGARVPVITRGSYNFDGALAGSGGRSQYQQWQKVFSR